MGLRTETKRNLAIGIAILIALSSMLVNHAAAASNALNLPSTPVRIEVKNGTESYFNTELSDVPAGYMWLIQRTLVGAWTEQQT